MPTQPFVQHDESVSIANRSIAVLIPCFNEEMTIGKVVADFKAIIPISQIYVYDNNSNDNTRIVAHRAGATTRTEALQGKGHVVRRMFADVEADLHVMVDGDATYDAEAVKNMIDLLTAENLDMVTGTRAHEINEAYRFGHQFANAVLTGAVHLVFGARITDMLSGYRVMSRRFVKSFPALSTGFEIETEFTIHALELKMPLGELLIRYYPRPNGSASKLKTIRDGVRIARTITMFVKDERPLPFFSAISGVLLIAALILGIPVISEFVRTGLVPRFPTAILSASLTLLSFLTLASGLILDPVSTGRSELKRLFYLSLPSPIGLRETNRWR